MLIAAGEWGRPAPRQRMSVGEENRLAEAIWDSDYPYDRSESTPQMIASANRVREPQVIPVGDGIGSDSIEKADTASKVAGHIGHRHSPGTNTELTLAESP